MKRSREGRPSFRATTPGLPSPSRTRRTRASRRAGRPPDHVGRRDPAACSASALAQGDRPFGARDLDCSRRSRPRRRSRCGTPRATPSARGRRACSAASTGSLPLLGEPLSLPADVRRRRTGCGRGARRRLRRRARAGPDGLALVGGHALPEQLRARCGELPRRARTARGGGRGHVLAAPGLADDDRFDARWRAAA